MSQLKSEGPRKRRLFREEFKQDAVHLVVNEKYRFAPHEALATQLRSQLQKEFDAEIRKKESSIAERERAVAQARQEVDKAHEEVERRVAEQLATQRKALSDEALVKAREQVTVELRDKDQQLADATLKLKTAQEAELAARKERRELEEQKQSLELTLTRRLDEERIRL